MKIQEKTKTASLKIVTVILETTEDYNNYLAQLEDDEIENVLWWIDDFVATDCSPNHNTWSGFANALEAKFNLMSDADGSHWKLIVKKAEKLK